MSSTERSQSPTVNQIGRYVLKAKAGEGASGVVYRAYDPLMDRDVAIKLARTNAMDPSALRRIVAEFRHEARIAGKFAHENVVTIYDVISESRINYIVMEYVPGRTVQDYMRATGPLTVHEALLVVHKCCVALAYIHYHGVIHRDIKPGNIMYHPPQRIAKLMDFSIAHKIEQPPVRDNGTIAYMAPEHFDKKRRISKLTDVFALGSTMYRILTGKYPFTREHTAYQILHEEPEPLHTYRPDVPGDVAALAERAMAKADADRFPSAAAFAREIEIVVMRHYPGADLLDGTTRYMHA